MTGPNYSQINLVSKFIKTSNFKIVDYETKKETKLSKQLKKHLDRNRVKKQPTVETMLKSLIKDGKAICLKPKN